MMTRIAALTAVLIVAAQISGASDTTTGDGTASPGTNRIDVLSIAHGCSPRDSAGGTAPAAGSLDCGFHTGGFNGSDSIVGDNALDGLDRAPLFGGTGFGGTSTSPFQ